MRSPEAPSEQGTGGRDGSVVLVLTPTGRDAESACRMLAQAGLASRAVSSLAELARHIDDRAGMALLASEALIGADMAPLVEALEAQPAWSDLPFVYLAARRAGPRARREPGHRQLSERVGNVLVLERPLSRESLFSAVGASLKSRARQFKLRDHVAQLAQHAEELRLSRQELVAANERREFLFGLAQRQRELASPDAIMELATEALRQRLAVGRVGFYRVACAGAEDETIRFGPSSADASMPALPGETPTSRLGAGFLARLRATATLRYEDSLGDPVLARSILPEVGSRAGLAIPFARVGRWEGGLYVHHALPRHWSDEEVALVEEVAQLSWDGVERAASELALRKSELQLVRTEERDRVWQLSRDLLAINDLDGVWRSVNPAWTTVLGWTPEELIGRDSQALLHPDDRATTLAQMERLRAGLPSIGFENRFRDRAGAYRLLSWSAVPVEGLIYSAARDVTEQRAQAAALREAEEQLRQAQKMEALGQLTGGIAHDFNNMLQGITSSLSVLRKKLALGKTDDLERFIDSGMRSALRAAGVTHRLLAFSRRQPLAPAQVELNQLVVSLAELLRQTLGESIALRFDLDANLDAVTCDPNQLENALLNLAINARDAMPDGGELAVTTRNGRRDEAEFRDGDASGFVVVAVCDSGVGMSPAIAARAFEPFFTTKPIGQGTGLGLSMIYGFAQQSKGECRIDSREGAGTTVSLYLPRTDASDAPPVEAGGQGWEDSALAGAQGRALVVEDDEVVRSLVVDSLRELGLQVLEADDGPAGLAMLQDEAAIDLLVTDVGLPGLNGRQLADAALAGRPDLKVLFMTGYADAVASADGFLKPGMRLLTKPFDLDVLTRQVCALLELPRSEAALVPAGSATRGL